MSLLKTASWKQFNNFTISKNKKMNLKNLILTPTGEMSREQWLKFRSPFEHVKQWVRDRTQSPHEQQNFPEAMFERSQANYVAMELIFKDQRFIDYVFPCLGGSEIATMMGLNQYKSSIELFYEKVGIKKVLDIDNIPMFWGRELEAQVAEKWQYWDGDGESMIDNFKKDNIIRKCRRVNAYIQNKKFPYIFVSLDRLINKMGTGVEGVLECKTISGFYSDKWEHGLPPDYLVQANTQMGTTELPFGEIALLKDGRYMDVLPFDFNEGIMNSVLKAGQSFYSDIKAGIVNYLLSMVTPEEQAEKMHLAIVDKFSPSPDGSVSYTEYLKATYTDKGTEIKGGAEQLDWAWKYKEANEKKKVIETEKNLQYNRLIAFIGNHSTLDLGSNGKVTYKTDARNVRTLRVNVK